MTISKTMFAVFTLYLCFNKLKKGNRYLEKKKLDFVCNEKNPSVMKQQHNHCTS